MHSPVQNCMYDMEIPLKIELLAERVVSGY